MSILLIALLPIARTFAQERRAALAAYERILAGEILDGEVEVLKAGSWKRLEPGVHPYTVRAESAASLPAGRFEVTVTTNRLRLEWRPEPRTGRGHAVVARETMLP
jgi:hypothetical protein